MEVICARNELTKPIRRLKKDGKAIALVPTMGALHEGHLSLVEAARRQADAVIVSIFVNPTQFGPNEDFTRYPRDEEADMRLLRESGADLAYLPTVEDMYPPGASTEITVRGISSDLCGAFRPGHFTGVATIVAKLLMQILPDAALFGEKDYQQLLIIRRMALDLDIPVRIEGAPILREADGLAMSSRNRYLTTQERVQAAEMSRILCDSRDALQSGEGAHAVLSRARSELLTAGFASVDYVELRDALTLEAANTGSSRLLAAAHLGTTRLIDNIAVELP